MPDSCSSEPGMAEDLIETGRIDSKVQWVLALLEIACVYVCALIFVKRLAARMQS